MTTMTNLTTKGKIVYTLIIIMVAVVAYGYRSLQVNEHGTLRELELEQALLIERETNKDRSAAQKAELTEQMLNRIASLEGKNDRLDSTGQLNYGNDPTEAQFAVCRQIGGWRPSECDTWTKYRYRIDTFQRHYKLVHGEDITEVEALIQLHTEGVVENVIATVVVDHPGTIWEWHGARKDRPYFNSVIPLIRGL